MKIEVNIEKKHFFGLLAFGLMVLGIVGVVAYNSNPANPSVFGHSVGEINWGDTIPGNVSSSGKMISNGFCIGTDCRTSWWPTSSAPSGVTKLIAGSGVSISSTNNDGTGEVTVTSTATGGSSQWTTSGSNIYYNSGNVGIGTASPGAKLEVNGQLKVTGGIVFSQSNSELYSCPALTPIAFVVGYSVLTCPNYCWGQVQTSPTCLRVEGRSGSNYCVNQNQISCSKII